MQVASIRSGVFSMHTSYNGKFRQFVGCLIGTVAVVGLSSTAFAQSNNWTGFYAGLNVGGAFSTGTLSTTAEIGRAHV